ncbi:MAG: glycosyltransferase [Candidatus Omnitrophica bacterium]|nr:glycosyltransferase [Candidatus Omnitrophota bacterium]
MQMDIRNVWAVVPAYNEGRKLYGIVSELKRRRLSVLVVDDGSTDDSAKIARAAGADKIISHPKNLGKGRSIKIAIAYLCASTDFEYMVTLDGDGQHAPGDLPVFFSAAAQGCDFVVGNRMANHRGMPRLRVATNRVMSWMISRITGQYIPDTQCGYRLIRKEVLEHIQIRTTKFEIESEILLKAARKGYRIHSVPIQSIYFQGYESNIHPVFDTIRFFRFLIKAVKFK